MHYLIVTFFTGGVVLIIVSAMDYYPVYQLAKSNFERRVEAT
jgi:type II secretory pathway component PulF